MLSAFFSTRVVIHYFRYHNLGRHSARQNDCRYNGCRNEETTRLFRLPARPAEELLEILRPFARTVSFLHERHYHPELEGVAPAAPGVVDSGYAAASARESQLEDCGACCRREMSVWRLGVPAKHRRGEGRGRCGRGARPRS